MLLETLTTLTQYLKSLNEKLKLHDVKSAMETQTSVSKCYGGKDSHIIQGT